MSILFIIVSLQTLGTNEIFTPPTSSITTEASSVASTDAKRITITTTYAFTSLEMTMTSISTTESEIPTQTKLPIVSTDVKLETETSQVTLIATETNNLLTTRERMEVQTSEHVYASLDEKTTTMTTETGRPQSSEASTTLESIATPNDTLFVGTTLTRELSTALDANTSIAIDPSQPVTDTHSKAVSFDPTTFVTTFESQLPQSEQHQFSCPVINEEKTCYIHRDSILTSGETVTDPSTLVNSDGTGSTATVTSAGVVTPPMSEESLQREDYKQTEDVIDVLATLSQDRRAEAGHQKETFIVDCQFAGVDCDWR